MGKPANRVEIGLIDFLRLGFFMLACRDSEYEVGDCGLAQHALQIFADIERHSKIRVTLEQLDSLTFHYKQAVVNKLDPSQSLKLTPDEYQSLMKSIKSYLPNHVRRDYFGELVLCGFNHHYGNGSNKARREAIKAKLQAEEKEFIESKV